MIKQSSTFRPVSSVAIVMDFANIAYDINKHEVIIFSAAFPCWKATVSHSTF